MVPTSPQQFERWLKIPVNLSASNWVQWSTFVETGLNALQKGEYLTDEPPNPMKKAWKSDESALRMILRNAMEPDILSTVHSFNQDY